MDYKTDSRTGVAEFVRFRRDPIAYVTELADRQLDVRHLRFGKRHVYLVNHPDIVRDVLITHDWNFIKGRGLRSSKPVLGNGLLTSEGELHRRQRRLAQPAFHSTRLTEYARTMVDCAARMSDDWQNGSDYDIHGQMTRLTLEIVGRALFSADVVHEAADIGQSLTEALRLFIALNSPIAQLVSPIRRWAERRAMRSRRKLENILGKVIADHRSAPDKYDDMLSMLLGSHDDLGAGYMSDQLLLDESVTLFLAGHETTANALAWTWYLLGQHPEAEDALHREIDRELQGRRPSLEDLSRLQFTAMLFREALRLYPPAWVISREAITDYRLGTIDVPAGANLFLIPYATQRDARFWEDPEEFRPERWREGASAARPKFAFFPFGAGTRVCIGENFAMMEGVLLIATFAQRWRLRLRPGQNTGLWPQITLRPRHEIKVQTEARSSSAPDMRLDERSSNEAPGRLL
ncbi:MAG TPA: cytochrome P450 [Acidobacteriaceae bacterium]